MTQRDIDNSADTTDELNDGSPEKLPKSMWITLVGFAAFVVLFGTCASNFMFN